MSQWCCWVSGSSGKCEEEENALVGMVIIGSECCVSFSSCPPAVSDRPYRYFLNTPIVSDAAVCERAASEMTGGRHDKCHVDRKERMSERVTRTKKHVNHNRGTYILIKGQLRHIRNLGIAQYWLWFVEAERVECSSEWLHCHTGLKRQEIDAEDQLKRNQDGCDQAHGC